MAQFPISSRSIGEEMTTGDGKRNTRASGYIVAILCTAAAALLTRILASLGDAGISPLFLAAIFFSAWYGGLGPGLLATFLSGAATAYLLIPEHGALPGVGGAVLRVVVFTMVALLVSSLNAATRRAAEAARKAREAAEEANAAKSRFVAMVSHELRSPLSPIAMVAEALGEDPALADSARAGVELIRRNVQTEIRLIDDLVDLSRIGAGKLNLQLRPVDLHQPMAAAAALLQIDAKEKQIQMTIDPAARDSMVMADSLRLGQIAWNLIRNAIKFTPECGSVRIRTFNRDQNNVCLEVSDTGIGIEEQHLQAIFSAFEQAGPDIGARFGGLGLGLAICQALSEAHGGSIQAFSAGRNQGATFTFCIPILREV